MVRIDTQVDKETDLKVKALAKKEDRKPAAMYRKLILEALTYRETVPNNFSSPFKPI